MSTETYDVTTAIGFVREVFAARDWPTNAETGSSLAREQAWIDAAGRRFTVGVVEDTGMGASWAWQTDDAEAELVDTLDEVRVALVSWAGSL